jgi:hypothetical protein
MLGEHIVHKLDKKYARPIAIGIMALALVAVTIKLIKML